MNDCTMASAANFASVTDGAWTVRLARRAVLSRFALLREGQLTVVENGSRHLFGQPAAAAPNATLEVLHPGFWTALALRGTLGSGEAYMDGAWRSDDLTALIRLFVLNRAALQGVDRGLARMVVQLARIAHAARANTRSGSRRNIAEHYDLGNDFFRLFLDETMMYSSAVFEHDAMGLHDASLAKLDRICRKLELKPEDHVLEIGTGWGGFALHAAQNYGCRVTTTTISRRQYEQALVRVAEAGLGGRVTVLLSDYRDLQGRYDKLVSIEMVEAVGAKFLDTFFSCCDRLLKPEGQMLLQAIVIADQFYDEALRSVDFIQRYIFPGSFIPSVTALNNSVKRATALKLAHMDDFGPHYARTLRAWRERFLANLEAVRAQGFSEQFIRMWEFYLSYCEGGFAERQLGVVQMLLTAPRCRREPLLNVEPNTQCHAVT